MDYKNLNKYKYIYHVYQSGNIIHIEKYPVIYINSKVIYFKTGRKEYLSCQHLCNFVNATEYSPKYYKWYDKYFIGKEKEVKEIFEDLKQQQVIHISKEKEQQAYSRFERAKKEFEEALTEIEVIEKLKIKLKEKQNADSKNQEA